MYWYLICTSFNTCDTTKNKYNLPQQKNHIKRTSSAPILIQPCTLSKSTPSPPHSSRYISPALQSKSLVAARLSMCPTVLFKGCDWWQKLDELQLKLKWRKICKRREVKERRRKILFDNWFPFHERRWKASIYRSLFNCAHSVAFQNQLIIISSPFSYSPASFASLSLRPFG